MAPHHRSGSIEIRPAERALYVDEQAVPLGARAFDLLLALIEHRRRVVSHDELLDMVWPGLVVEMNNLQVQVSTLRKTLGPQAIATIPGRGYRFTLPLDEDRSGDAAPASSAPPGASLTGATDGATPGATPQMPPAMPVLAAPPFGRDADLEALDQLAREHRLISVVGPGGIGKTTLVRAAAPRLTQARPETVAWVELGSLAEPSLLAGAVARALGLPASAANDPLPALIEALRHQAVWLLLDGAEHLIDMTARLADAILARAPQVRLLVTSQVPLKVGGEWVYRLGPLSVPEPGGSSEQALAHGAVSLFAARARAADRQFEVTPLNVSSVVDLCRRLEGLPLAIELAAARMPLLGLNGVQARLGERLRLLRNTAQVAPTRQQTLRAALDWSHGLLDAAAQKVLRRLGVFSGGFSLDLAAAVASDATLDEWTVVDQLGTLVDRSLVAADAAAVPRYRLLESTREFALFKLDEAGEREALRGRHAHALRSAFERAYAEHWSGADRPWLTQWAPELDNVRAALDWATANEPPLAIALMGAVSPLFLLLGLAHEARQRCALLHHDAQPSNGSETAAQRAALARYWLERARFCWRVSMAQMHDCAALAADLFRAADDPRGLYMALRCTIGSGELSRQAAALALDEMGRLEQPAWPARLRAQRRMAEIVVLKAEGRLDDMRRAAEALLELSGGAGLDLVHSATLNELAALHLAQGRPAEAVALARRVTEDGTRRRDNFVVHAHATLAQAALEQGQAAEARAAVVGLIDASRSRDWEWFGLFTDLCAWLAASESRPRAAAHLLGHADAGRTALGERSARMATVRAAAAALVDAALPRADIERLMADGAQADVETVCRWTLDEVPE